MFARMKPRKRGRAARGRSARQRLQANAEPTFRKPSSGTKAFGPRNREPETDRTAVPIGDWTGASNGTEMFRTKHRKGWKSGESLPEARRNRPGPQGLGRNRNGDPPKQQCGKRGTREEPIRRPQGSGRFRSAQRGKILSLADKVDKRGKVGAGGNTDPHYFLAPAPSGVEGSDPPTFEAKPDFCSG